MSALAPLLILIVVVAVVLWIFRRRMWGGDKAVSTSAITPAQAQAGAHKGFEEYGLLRRADWRPLLAPPARALEPLLVERLDAVEAADAYYYLVPIGVDDGAVGAAAMVDGVSGEYLEASAFAMQGSTRTWGAMIADWRSEVGTRQRIIDGKYVSKSGGPLEVDAQSVQIHPAFVWKPCHESRSPFYPFRRVSSKGRVRYVRIDAMMFEALTDLSDQRPAWLKNEPDPTSGPSRGTAR